MRPVQNQHGLVRGFLMSSSRLLRAYVAAIIGASATYAGTAWAQGAAAAAPDAELEEVTVTGSRVITENVKSPTPIASLDVEEAAKTTPSDIADAINKLPQIVAGG